MDESSDLLSLWGGAEGAEGPLGSSLGVEEVRLGLGFEGDKKGSVSSLEEVELTSA